MIHHDEKNLPLIASRITGLSTHHEKRTTPTMHGLSFRVKLRLQKERVIKTRTKFGEEVLSYIVGEMKNNSISEAVKDIYKQIHDQKKGSESDDLETFLKNHPGPCANWYALVADHHPWDHKPMISAKWGGYQIIRFKEIGLHGWVPFYYSIWSCIHYGYVGLAAGFPQKVLEDGANIAHLSVGLRPQPLSDLMSMRIGMELYRTNTLSSHELRQKLYNYQNSLLQWDIEHQRSFMMP